MDVATTLYMRNMPNPEVLPARDDSLSAGERTERGCRLRRIPFELIYKVLVRVGGRQHEGLHEPSRAHEKLAPRERTEVERIVTTHGWKDASELLAHLDEHLCDKDP